MRLPRLPQIRCFHTSPRLAARDPVQQYDHYVKTDRIINDPNQRKTLLSLSFLYNQLLNYFPPPPQPPAQKSLFRSWFSKPLPAVGSQPNGIYLYGDVGCGKSMLMDMFYSTIPPHLTKKRIHFHSFMQSVHKQSFQLHATHGIDYDTAPEIAASFAKNANVLCFDEFQVTDVADAMILRRLIEAFLSPSLGVVLFITSNRAPDDLYLNGIQRDSFLPTISLIKQKSNVIYLQSPTDYRKLDRISEGTYFFPPKGSSLADVAKQAQAHVDYWFARFASSSSSSPSSSSPSNSSSPPPAINAKLHIWGRPINIPKSVPNKVALFAFQDLFNHPLSAADYLEITRAFPAIIITDIPFLSIAQRDVTRRFITFLDAAYESHTKLVVTAVSPFEHIFTDEIPTYAAPPPVKAVEQRINRPLQKSQNVMLSNQFAGDDERFAFARALSRLKQMASKEWHEYQL